MNILAFVDIHGNKEKLKEILKRAKDSDIIICCGDISIWGNDLKYLISELEKTQTISLIIHGNHESEEEMEKVCSNLKFVKFLHKKTFTFKDYTFFGYGGGGFSLVDKQFENFYKSLDLKNKKLISFTHAPPYGTNLDKLNSLGYRGNKSIRKFIEDLNPLIHFCGHLHESAGKEDKIKNTRIINPGEGKLIKI